MLAQGLIARAWERATPNHPASAPWPWADTRPIARLWLPAAPGRARARELFVLEGSSGRNLAFGPAHDTASVLPGARGNSVIEGHRDTHFAALRALKPHDRIEIELAAHHRITFEIVDVRVVDSRRFRIALDAPTARLTLVTCYPFDALTPGGSLRLVVTADRV